jgi:hypothetical protein
MPGPAVDPVRMDISPKRPGTAGVRYEVRVEGKLSERASGAFPGMEVEPIPSQTAICGVLDDPAELGELLARCRVMGFRVLSLRRLSTREPVDPAGPGSADRAG